MGELSIRGALFLDVTKSCFEMFAGTIMCYGQTGAGKTYTMTGTTENYQHRGILPRALQQVESGPVGGMPSKSPLLDAANHAPATGDSGVKLQSSCSLQGQQDAHGGGVVWGSACQRPQETGGSGFRLWPTPTLSLFPRL